MGTNSAVYTAIDAAAVTPHASTNISPPNPRALYIGVGGDVTLVTRSGGVILFKNAQSGSVIPVQGVVRVNAIGTGATDIVALY